MSLNWGASEFRPWDLGLNPLAAEFSPSDPTVASNDTLRFNPFVHEYAPAAFHASETYLGDQYRSLSASESRIAFKHFVSTFGIRAMASRIEPEDIINDLYCASSSEDEEERKPAVAEPTAFANRSTSTEPSPSRSNPSISSSVTLKAPPKTTSSLCANALPRTTSGSTITESYAIFSEGGFLKPNISASLPIKASESSNTMSPGSSFATPWDEPLTTEYESLSSPARSLKSESMATIESNDDQTEAFFSCANAADEVLGHDDAAGTINKKEYAPLMKEEKEEKEKKGGAPRERKEKNNVIIAQKDTNIDAASKEDAVLSWRKEDNGTARFKGNKGQQMAVCTPATSSEKFRSGSSTRVSRPIYQPRFSSGSWQHSGGCERASLSTPPLLYLAPHKRLTRAQTLQPRLTLSRMDESAETIFSRELLLRFRGCVGKALNAENAVIVLSTAFKEGVKKEDVKVTKPSSFAQFSWREAASETKKAETKKKKAGEDVRLKASEKSWGAQQKRQGTACDDATIVRRMKSLLNKLTIEKFDSLYQQLLNCGISTTEHVEMLMKEVFEKATTQHHFIEMYAVLCVNLNDWLQKKEIGCEERSFKRILLNQCQASFEANLTPPKELIDASVLDEEAFELRVKYKTKVLGNIKLVGRLLVNRMLASRILISSSQILLEDYTSETIESLVVLMTTTGPSFDDPSWIHHKDFCDIFAKIQELRNDKSVASRIRFLLQDVLDLRERGWTSRHAESCQPEMVPVIKQPLKCARKDSSPFQQRGTSFDRTSVPVTACIGCRSSAKASPKTGPWRPQWRTTSAVSSPTTAGTDNARPPTKATNEDAGGGSLETFHRECSSVLRGFARDELTVEEGVDKLSKLPSKHRQAEWLNLVSRILDEPKISTRRQGFTLASHLTEEWEGNGLNFKNALNNFAADFDDLLMDVPRLSEIVASEFCVVFKNLLPDKHPFSNLVTMD